MSSDDYAEDRKKRGKNKLKYKSLEKNFNCKDDETRDRKRIRHRIKSKIEEIRQEELWEDWEDEIS